MPDQKYRHLHLVPDLEPQATDSARDSMPVHSDADTIRLFRASEGKVDVDELVTYAQALARQYQPYADAAGENHPAAFQKVPMLYKAQRRQVLVQFHVANMPDVNATMPLVVQVGSEILAVKANGSKRISRLAKKSNGTKRKPEMYVFQAPLSDSDMQNLSHILRRAEPVELRPDDAESNAPTVPQQLGVMVVAEAGNDSATSVENNPVDTAELDLLKMKLEAFLATNGAALPGLPDVKSWRSQVANGVTLQIHLDHSEPSEPLLEYRLEVLQRVGGQSKRPKVVKNPETGEVGTAVDLYSMLWQGDELDIRRGVIYRDSANYPAQTAAEAQIMERVHSELHSATQDPALVMRQAYLDTRKTHTPDTLTPALMTLFETHLEKVLNRS